jgi:hypothetical protein
MATLVFSTVGTILGGPVGGAIGAMIGQSIDQQILGPSGPKSGDLKVQTSDYGTPIPRVFGTMRVAGTIVWATDLIAGEQTSGAKGQASAVTSYSASFAVALSSRTAGAVGRIWADGKLLRGAAGDFKVETGFRFYPGSEGQEIDPLIGSAEGIDATPAYRGIALAVFENLQLAEYGNRIPFLTFELIADPAAVSAGAILADASRGAIMAGAVDGPAGYAAYGSSIRAAVAPLIANHAIDLFDDGEMLRTGTPGPWAVTADDLGSSPDRDGVPRIERELASARSLPASLRLTYYDPARDYQSGEARAAAGEVGGAEERHDYAGALAAGQAKSLAHRALARRWAERETVRVRLGPRFLPLEPGAKLVLPDGSEWRAATATIDGLVVIAELKPCWRPTPALAADGGRALPPPDVVAGAVTLALVETVTESGEVALALAASSPTPGWRKQTVEVHAGGDTFMVATPRTKSVVGMAETVLGEGPSLVRDDRNELVVALLDPDQWLQSCDDAALGAGANLAALGEEVLQFGRAEALGGGRFRLGRLLRGRGGSEWAIGGHGAGEMFVLLDPARLTPIMLRAAMVGATISVEAGAVSASRTVSGAGRRPLSPVHLAATLAAGGDAELRWVRRSRGGLDWLDEVDAPLGERIEAYRVRLSGAGGTVAFESSDTALTLSAAELAPFGPGTVAIEVRQIGDHAASRPATTTLILP